VADIEEEANGISVARAICLSWFGIARSIHNPGGKGVAAGVGVSDGITSLPGNVGNTGTGSNKEQAERRKKARKTPPEQRFNHLITVWNRPIVCDFSANTATPGVPARFEHLILIFFYKPLLPTLAR
jgi:hypothetical protein